MNYIMRHIISCNTQWMKNTQPTELQHEKSLGNKCLLLHTYEMTKRKRNRERLQQNCCYCRWWWWQCVAIALIKIKAKVVSTHNCCWFVFFFAFMCNSLNKRYQNNWRITGTKNNMTFLKEGRIYDTFIVYLHISYIQTSMYSISSK